MQEWKIKWGKYKFYQSKFNHDMTSAGFYALRRFFSKSCLSVCGRTVIWRQYVAKTVSPIKFSQQNVALYNVANRMQLNVAYGVLTYKLSPIECRRWNYAYWMSLIVFKDLLFIQYSQKNYFNRVQLNVNNRSLIQKMAPIDCRL